MKENARLRILEGLSDIENQSRQQHEAVMALLQDARDLLETGDIHSATVKVLEASETRATRWETVGIDNIDTAINLSAAKDVFMSDVFYENLDDAVGEAIATRVLPTKVSEVLARMFPLLRDILVLRMDPERNTPFSSIGGPAGISGARVGVLYRMSLDQFKALYLGPRI